MAAACLTLYETTFDTRWFTEARALADDLLRLFHDGDGGGFFQTGIDAERLVLRPKELFDNAVPSGNSAAAEVLLRLAFLTGEGSYESAAVSALRLVRDYLERAPTGFGNALAALDRYVGPSKEIAIVGDLASDEAGDLVETVWREYRPKIVMAAGSPDRGDVVPLLADRTTVDGGPAAYVCERFACRMPVSDPEALTAQLD
ncbi:MAG TPA: hypothetical protein VG709_01800 [Actinomycetota bacterium]|nr:hypothetical protein [Actinomycetota bacterium]